MISSPRRHGRGTSDGVVQLEHLHLAIAILNRQVVLMLLTALPLVVLSFLAISSYCSQGVVLRSRLSPSTVGRDRRACGHGRSGPNIRPRRLALHMCQVPVRGREVLLDAQQVDGRCCESTSVSSIALRFRRDFRGKSWLNDCLEYQQ